MKKLLIGDIRMDFMVLIARYEEKNKLLSHKLVIVEYVFDTTNVWDENMYPNIVD